MIIWLLVLILVILDQIIKYLVVHNISLYGSIIIIKNFFSLTYVRNTGAAFSLFANKQVFLIIIAVLVILYLIKFMQNNKKINLFKKICLALILGGTIGNLIDRIIHGYVIDYFAFTIFKREMAIFNLADAILVVGTILLLFNIYVGDKNEKRNRFRR